jgi:hypothetical protein
VGYSWGLLDIHQEICNECERVYRSLKEHIRR